MSLALVYVSNASSTPKQENLLTNPKAYTTFSYSALTTSYTDKTAGSTAPGPGGAVGLFDTVATVTAKITNNGTVTGAEVAQLYLGLPASAPASPPKQLRGFQKVNLLAGASSTVTFDIRRKDLSYWDVGSQAWKVPAGTFNVYVGASSRDVRLTGTF
jgi:beta-glucosidase